MARDYIRGADAERDREAPWNKSPVLAAAAICCAAIVAAILWRVRSGLVIPWWFNTDEVVSYYEVIRQLRLDPSQTFFDIPGTPYITLTSIFTYLWWAIERVSGHAANLRPSDFAFVHVQGVFTLMRTITMSFYAVAAGLVFDLSRRAGGALTAIIATFLFATLPIHIAYSHFARTESMGLVLMLSAIWILLHSRIRGTPRAYAAAGLLCGVAMAARYHFALAAIPAVAAILITERRDGKAGGNRRWLVAAVACLGVIFIAGAAVTVALDTGMIGAGRLTNTLLLTTSAGPNEFPDAKNAIALLWMILGVGALGIGAVARFGNHSRVGHWLLNRLAGTFIVTLAAGFVMAHPEFLWRGAYQLKSIQFYHDWIDPDLLKLGWLAKWWRVSYFYLDAAFPERWLKLAFAAGSIWILFRRQPLAIAALAASAACFLAHPLNMKTWPHHIIPWLPFLCIVAAIPLAEFLTFISNSVMRRFSRPVFALAAVVVGAAGLSWAMRGRLQAADSYLKISYERTDRIAEMDRWMTNNVPRDSYLLVSYFALNEDGFFEWIRSAGVQVPDFVKKYRESRIWWLNRGDVDGHAGYICMSPADIKFFHEDFERRAPGSTYDPITDPRFVPLAKFGDGFYELRVFRFDFR